MNLFKSTILSMKPRKNGFSIRQRGKTSRARIRAHRYFDLIWQNKLLTRTQAYQFLPIITGKYHFGQMTAAQCDRCVEKLKQLFPHLYEGKDLDDDLLYP